MRAGFMRLNRTLSTKSTPPYRFMVGIDGSPASEMALKTVAHLVDSERGDTLKLLHIPRVIDTLVNADMEKELLAAIINDSQRVIKSAEVYLDKSFPDIKHSSLITDQYRGVRANLFDAVTDIDILVLGSKGHSKFHKFFVGSTVDFALNHLHTDLLVVRPKSDISGKSE